MRDGVRIVNCARGQLIDLDALQRGLESGKVAGAALDVFPEEPFTEHPLFERDDVVVTPHLGASTAEAQDRAGTDTAEQVARGAHRRRRHQRGQHRRRAPGDDGGAGAVRAAVREARPPRPGPRRGHVDRVEVAFRGRIAEHDTRLLGIAVLVGILSGHTEEPVNLVNAPAMAEDRGIELTELKDSASEDFTELVTVRHRRDVEVAGTGVGPRNVPYLVGVWGQSFYMPFADHLAIFRYADQPGMIGRVGTAFGEHGVNIVSAAVGAEASGEEAVMALTTDAAVPQEVIDEIASGDGFFAGRASTSSPPGDDPFYRIAPVRRSGTIVETASRLTCAAERVGRRRRDELGSCVEHGLGAAGRRRAAAPRTRSNRTASRRCPRPLGARGRARGGPAERVSAAAAR